MRAMALLLAAVMACAGSACPGAPPPSSWSDAGADAAATSSDAAPPVPGLRAAYFVGYEDLALERIEPTLDVDWGDGGPDGTGAVGTDRFSARWTGFLVAPASGTYRIATETDDGVRLWIGGQLVIDDWHGHFVTRNEASVELVAGAPVALRLDYFEIDLAASARVLWSSDALPEEVVPAASLRAAAAPSGLPGPKPPYVNPVVPYDCPDPGVLAHGGGDGGGDGGSGYTLVCTGGSFPIRTSRGLVSWADTGAAVLPDGKPPWAANGFRNWAPEIHRVGDHFVAYYTTVNGADVLSIGAASAADVLGPYTDSGAPLVADPAGVIDATFFEDDDGARWLLYKIDGNAFGQPTPIFVRRLTDDGLAFAPGSAAVEVLRNDAGTWEGGGVEAPWVVKRDGLYYLFYSGNVYDHRYRTGVARASGLTGPYQKHGPPILANNERWVGPGHGSLVAVGASDYFVYHAWTNAGDGTQNGAKGRQVLVDRIVWQDGWPTIHDGTPSRSPQPWPGQE